jgi:two-component system sensor histidine kinase KdpD
MTDDGRPDPDRLIAQMRVADAAAARGKLRIYFGSSAGVGKTYAMLQAAQQLHAGGADVLAGVVVTHGRSDTVAMLDGLPQLPLKAVEYRGKTLPEFDLDAALARQPALILVDELAHSNVAGSRHAKRWQDVEELLDKGINVYSTLNVQHLESLNDVVGGITGVRVQETLPDTFFDRADEVLLVDTPADELLSRLNAGKVYVPAQAERAAKNFFRKGNLMALRELALRRTADRVEDDVQAWRSMQKVDRVWKTEAALLCAVGPNPAAESVVRASALLAQQLNVSWQAVYVETATLQRLPDAQRDAILRVVRLAQELGATTAVLQAQDVAAALLAHAREHNLSKLVLGRSGVPRTLLDRMRGAGLASRIGRAAPDLDILSVAARPSAPPRAAAGEATDAAPALARWPGYAWSAAACLGVTALCWPLQWHFAQANIVMLFLLAVLAVALRLGRGPAVLASFLSVGLFDFFFVEPKLSFAVSDVQYLVTFAVMLAVGLITGQLTAGLRYQARVAAERETRARALFELTSRLAGALEPSQVREIAEDALAGELHGRALLFTLDLNEQLQPSPRQTALPEGERPDAGTARWSLDNARPAGLTTDTLPGSGWFYLPLQATMRVRGVLALRPAGSAELMRPELRAQLETSARIIGQALERVHYVEVAQQALVQIEGERLRNSLLSALSHDLRTPLAVVYGLAQTLAAQAELPATTRELTQSLLLQSRRISAMVSNLLDMARLQSGAVRLNLQWQPLDEVVGVVLNALQPTLAGHRVVIDLPATLPLLHLDASLIERVFANLLENAVKYTPAGTAIRLAARPDAQTVIITVSDQGPGLPAGKEELVFEKFARGEKESSTPGVGLGLTICRAIVEAHGGRIWAEPAHGSGASFNFSLPRGTPPALPAAEE